jgi:hypothetical protein
VTAVPLKNSVAGKRLSDASVGLLAEWKGPPLVELMVCNKQFC